jgi:ribosomal protein S18 acetylase RimI-like enzyme
MMRARHVAAVRRLSMQSAPADIPVVIRTFDPSDLADCRKLYIEGLIGGKIAENDTGFDMDDIVASYMKAPGNHFWVAENDKGEVVGMIGVHHYEEGTGEIRRLRVRQDSQRRGIGGKLVETALRFCQDLGYLKVTLDTFMEREPAVKLFQKFRFRHSRTRTVSGKELMYFYLDLYTSDVKKDE